MWLRSHTAVALERLPATAPIRPLAWEPPYASAVALKRKRKRNPPNENLDTEEMTRMKNTK